MNSAAPGVRSTDVPATPFQPRSSVSQARRSSGSTSCGERCACSSKRTSPRSANLRREADIRWRCLRERRPKAAGQSCPIARRPTCQRVRRSQGMSGRGQPANQGPPRRPGGHGRFEKHQRPRQSRHGGGNRLANGRVIGRRGIPKQRCAGGPGVARQHAGAKHPGHAAARPTAGRPASGLRRPRPMPGNGWRGQSAPANRRSARPGPAATCSRSVARDRPRPARRPEARRSC